MKLKPSLPKIVFTVFIAIGVGLLISNIYKQLSWKKTSGLVLEVLEKEDESNQFYPLVKFQLSTGEEVEVEVRQSSNRGYYEKGESIPLIYPKLDYQDAEIDSIVWVYGFPAFFIILGGLAFFIPEDLWYVS